MYFKGERFVHDLRNRPEGYDVIRDPSPTAENVPETAKNTSMLQDTKIRKTIEEELPIKTVFKKPK